MVFIIKQILDVFGYDEYIGNCAADIFFKWQKELRYLCKSYTREKKTAISILVAVKRYRPESFGWREHKVMNAYLVRENEIKYVAHELNAHIETSVQQSKCIVTTNGDIVLTGGGGEVIGQQFEEDFRPCFKGEPLGSVIPKIGIQLVVSGNLPRWEKKIPYESGRALKIM